MTRFRSIAFNVFFFGELTLFLISMLTALPLPRIFLRKCIRQWAKTVRWSLKAIAGIDYEVRGLENLPESPVILASKHQSFWETVAFVWMFHYPVFCIKKELFKIPLWGWYASKCQQVVVDRKGGGAALKSMVRDSLKALERGRDLIVFPEGTRVAPDAKGDYHPGIAAIYARADRPLIPVALNSGMFWGRRTFTKRPGTIVVEFLPAIPPGLDRREFMRQLEESVETATARLVAEAKAKHRAD
jgi:1-acyl-sn-glycerol-3-phosphate acyltransferase